MTEPSISVCYIVRNEELFLEASLNSIQDLASEIIIVDTGSRDSSLSIERRFATRLAKFEWKDDFSAARNFAANLARCDWIFFVDGDEILETNGAKKMKEGLQAQPEIYAHGVLQRNYTNERSYPHWKSIRAENSGEILPLVSSLAGFVDNLMMKLYRHHCGIEWQGVIHETMVGSCQKLGLKHLEEPLCILHHMKELKTEGFRKEKQLYYLKLALQKLKADSVHENPWFEVGISLNNMGNYIEAERAFKEALSRRPDWHEARLFHARTLLQLNRNAEAEIILRGLMTSPNLANEARGHLSTALLYQGKCDECEALIEETLAQGVGHLSLHINAGTLYFEKKEFEKSQFHFAEALKINPTDAFLLEALEKANFAVKLTDKHSLEKQT